MLWNNGSMSGRIGRYNNKGLQFQVKEFGCYRNSTWHCYYWLIIGLIIPRYCVSLGIWKVWELEGFRNQGLLTSENACCQTHSVAEGTSLRSPFLCFPRVWTTAPFMDEKRTYCIVTEIVYVSDSPIGSGVPMISESLSLTTAYSVCSINLHWADKIFCSLNISG